MRNKVNGNERPHGRIFHGIDRERDAVDGNRSLVGKIRREFDRRAHDESITFVNLFKGLDLTDAVHMTAHQMSVDAIA